MSSEPFDLITLIEEDINNRYQFPSRNFPEIFIASQGEDSGTVSYTHLRAHETPEQGVWRGVL